MYVRSPTGAGGHISILMVELHFYNFSPLEVYDELRNVEITIISWYNITLTVDGRHFELVEHKRTSGSRAQLVAIYVVSYITTAALLIAQS